MVQEGKRAFAAHDQVLLRSTLLSQWLLVIESVGKDVKLFKEGDQAWAGAAIAELPDMTTIHARAPVLEADRGRV